VATAQIIIYRVISSQSQSCCCLLCVVFPWLEAAGYMATPIV